MSYGDYLSLDTILAAQHPRSPDHNEMLFIVQHQTSELWMKLMLHELGAAIQTIARDELGSAFKMLSRVSKIMEQLVHAWDVLATMTPPEYSAIRPYLDNSSGFQSYQYRCIEFSLGNKNAAMLKPHAHRPDLLARVQAAYAAPSLYDESLRLLARRGIAVPPSHTLRDWSQPYTADAGVGTAIKRVKLAGLLRNDCVVAANAGAEDCLEPLVRLATHVSPLVRQHAVWAVYKLAGKARAEDLLAAARATEGDVAVLAEYACWAN